MIIFKWLYRNRTCFFLCILDVLPLHQQPTKFLQFQHWWLFITNTVVPESNLLHIFHDCSTNELTTVLSAFKTMCTLSKSYDRRRLIYLTTIYNSIWFLKPYFIQRKDGWWIRTTFIRFITSKVYLLNNFTYNHSVPTRTRICHAQQNSFCCCHPSYYLHTHDFEHG